HEVDGLTTHYQQIPYENKMGPFRRVLAFFQFVRFANKKLETLPKIDLLYVLSTPLTTGLIARRATKKLAIPYLFEVGDLWPDAPIQLGYLPNRWIQNRLYKFEEATYREAKELVALSPAIKEAMEYRLDYSRTVEVIPNMSDCNFFVPRSTTTEHFDEQNPFVITYAGAIGFANHVQFLLDFAAECKNQRLPVRFSILGDGAEKASLMEASKEQNNIHWEQTGGKEAVKLSMIKSHAVFISYHDFSILETGSPNKLFDGLAAGQMIIINFGGWIKSLIESNECGISYVPNNAPAGVHKLRQFIESPLMVASYRENARRLAETDFDVSLLTQKALSVVTR
ncbi:MAG: glycosyltransferase involved in cell wall biosynthesis, partial [Cyclobacteriaceae bacterium]